MQALLIAARPRTLQWLSETFGRRRHGLTVVEDSEAACRACALESFPLAIFEADSFDDQGVELCQRLRGLAPPRPCTILALGQSDQPEQLAKLLAAGADDCLLAGSDTRRLEGWLAAAACRVKQVGRLGWSLPARPQPPAEPAVRDSKAKLRTLLENLPDLVLIVDREGLIRFVNRDAPGASAEEMIAWDVFEYIAPEHRDRGRAAFEQVFASQQTQIIETLDVFGHWWTARVVPLPEQGKVRSVMVICADISEQKATAEAVTKEQQLLRQLIELHERERQLIAYEIHDGFAQQVAGALYNFEAFNRLRSEHPDKAQQSFDEARQMLNRSIGEARRLIGGLRPPILDEFGIVAAIDYLICESPEHGSAEIEFSHHVQFDRLAPPLESTLFRIVQESLANARRHSRSKAIRVELHQEGDCVCVNVRDWGIGFEPAAVKEGRFGLQGIRERVRLLGGQVTIVTAPGQGTQVCAALPLIERVSS